MKSESSEHIAFSVCEEFDQATNSKVDHVEPWTYVKRFANKIKKTDLTFNTNLFARELF